MPAPLRLKGLPASAGFAAGPLWQPPKTAGGYKRKESREAELAALEDAMAASVAETAELIAAAEGEAAEILEFQLAMLEDDNFRTVSAERIDEGLAADAAWTATLDAEIEGYETSGDEYFRARATDLADIRDRVLAALTGTVAPRIPEGSIYFSEDIAPSAFLSHDWMGGGLVLKHGSATGHVAILARQRGIPVIVGIGDAGIRPGSFALVDAVRGEIVLEPGETEQADFEAARQGHAQRLAASHAFAPKPAMTADGRPVRVLVNIADPAEIAAIDIAHVDGVGLMRTEFLFGHGLPSEDEQFAAYRKVLAWAGTKPVTIRTIDAGGDKPVAGLTEDEPNPFLGMRGVRLSLAKPEIFAIQIRALLRAAVAGNLKVMLPMVSVPQEVDEARRLFREEAARLKAAGIEHAVPPIGIMVEVPSVAVTPGRFAQAEFFSIGSNDLVQYVLAASRDNWKLASIARVDDPAVLQLLRVVARCGLETGREVSLCGDAASNPEMVPHLLAAGLESLSVAASAIGEVKAAIARWRPGTSE
jgi:phosphoenolpyruvate-protein phosphotransferase (PTS system enzyme I)